MSIKKGIKSRRRRGSEIVPELVAHEALLVVRQRARLLLRLGRDVDDLDAAGREPRGVGRRAAAGPPAERVRAQDAQRAPERAARVEELAQRVVPKVLERERVSRCADLLSVVLGRVLQIQ